MGLVGTKSSAGDKNKGSDALNGKIMLVIIKEDMKLVLILGQVRTSKG